MSHFKQITPRLPVADLRRSIAFYTEVLGFQVDLAWPAAQPTFCILQRDGVALGLYVPNVHHPAAALGVGELSIEVEDVLSLHRMLHGKAAIEWGPEVYFYGRREFAIRDPDDYLLIFTEPTDDPVTCSET